ncbi:MAG: hypothetical protein IJA69_05440, partial [Clostridia bacterium]|nr:hypothetical protein [Clostridia bacterium]
IISITGKFEGINDGSKLVVSSLAVVENQEIIASNYKIVTTNVEGEIVKKDITIDIGTTNTKFYDGKVLVVTGSVIDSQIGATYVYKVQTTDVVAGKYLASEGKLEVVAFGVGTQNANGVTITQDMTNNFTIELKGSAEIKKVETTLVWENTKVVFNGQQQQISFTLANEGLRQGLAYEIYYSESFGNLGTKDAPRNAKLYYVTMQILENSNVEIKENLSTTFTISQKTIYISPNAGENFEKVYDGLLTINASYSIFADENKTTPIETAIANYQEITLEFAFSSKNAGTNKAVSVRLLEDNEENKNYVLAAGTAFVGTITKKDITLKISPSTGNVLSKQYDGVAFEVFAKDVVANTLANNEELDGSLIFTNVINAKTYTLTSESFDVANLNASGTNIKTNYNILTTSFKDDQITITKAKLIYTVVKAQYVYDGEPVDIETLFERQDGKADPLPEVTYKFFANNSDVVETQQPTYVGTYYFDFVLSDSNNYEIVNNKRVEFKITKRSVYIEVIESVKYTGEVITYDVTSANVVFRTLPDSTQSYGFAPGDVSGLKLTTTNAKVGIYYVKQASEISHTTEIFEETDTQKSNNLYSNYIIYYTEESYIAIEKTEIDFQSIMTIDANTTYNGKVQVLGIQFTEENTNRVVNIKFGETNEDGIITNVFRTQGENTIAITDSKDIYYAGVYTFGLSLTNYEIKNYKQFSKTISAREIVYLQIDGKDITQELLDKQYDGTTTLLGTITAPCDEQKYPNKQIVDSDVSLISVRGNYEQANVKASQKV